MKNKCNLYEVLGVSETASIDEIKNNYRKLAKQYHPDAHPNDSVCKEKFQTINEAYSILSNSEKRKVYDKELQNLKKEQEDSFQTSQSTQKTTKGTDVNFEEIHKTFERFFGFNPNTGDVSNMQKSQGKKKNPLDTTDIFERFMGIKR